MLTEYLDYTYWVIIVGALYALKIVVLNLK